MFVLQRFMYMSTTLQQLAGPTYPHTQQRPRSIRSSRQVRDSGYATVAAQRQVGDKAVDYQPAFQLYLTTRAPSLAVHPATAAWLAPVNFSVSRGGLEAELLSITVQHHVPHVEQRKQQLLDQVGCSPGGVALPARS